MQNSEIATVAEVKQVWVRPSLKRIEAGSAESASGTRSDGGGGLQGS